jgi:hypothetical protein
MAIFFHKWRTKMLQGAVLLLVVVVCFILIDQTRNEVILINRASSPITIEEVFIGKKIPNPKMEPFGFEFIHTRDSDVLRDYVLGPNERVSRSFRVPFSRLFRVAYVTPERKSYFRETGHVESWGNRYTFEFKKDGETALENEPTFLRSMVNRIRNSIPLRFRWLD